MTPGTLLISLDFELYWGVRDHRSLEEYGKNIIGVRTAIPAMLEMFREYGIHVTWATVGFVFFTRKKDLIAGCPERKPNYNNPNLSPYTGMQKIGDSEQEDPYHYGRSLIEMIRRTPGQEIGTHTFSHYYCLEPGQDEESFRDDLRAAVRIAQELGVTLASLVFPRNQTNAAYLKVCADAGITSYRGTEKAWYYAKGSREDESKLARLMRLADSYFNFSGNNTYPLPEGHAGPVNLPSSRFLRPFKPSLEPLDGIRMRRICHGIRHAARKGEVYHLWWHPHNFGTHLQKNMELLRTVLDTYRRMREQYGMESLTMAQAAARARQAHV